jgi:hypothetical protein
MGRFVLDYARRLSAKAGLILVISCFFVNSDIHDLGRIYSLPFVYFQLFVFTIIFKMTPDNCV